ncbi:hypothetical protein BK816_03075 [Boudabousia tangfeifanii]|uniref:PTS EIIB type-1 domain-containing protein n=1 Tax=Boudabousia tangfeifanii TaxID=1912795 RepID=A0A1D9MJ80_9ACTO|nr:PTS glucose/sucrose transporter subunit IIB [Boudabousia tangfeifanii]AOZ72401.1 hypothetical protein BK816_03075 [Boudabousia tangfeifanii]
MMTNIDLLISGLGGPENIVEIEPCITRLRIEVHSTEKIDSKQLRASGCHGLMQHGVGIQIVVGPHAELIAEQISQEIWSADDEKTEII